MDRNESPYPPPPDLVAEVINEIESVALNRYPEDRAGRLVGALSDHVAWPADGLWVANGSNEVLLHLFLAFGGHERTSVTFEPTYPVHSHISEVTGTAAIRVRRAEDLVVDLDAAVRAITERRPEIVIVCSPNNPSGGCEPLSTVRALLEESRGLVVVDEAYGEFADPVQSVRPLLDEYRNLVLLKTFSKAWRLAGVRVGYMLADPGLVAELTRVRLPFHLSAITQVVGRAALRHWRETIGIARAITIERDRISVELQAMGVKTYPSDANFVLFDVDAPERVWQRLLDRGVLVRRYSGREGLERSLRVTAGLPEETNAFLEAMTTALEE
jgi:histidinol-phosphate aminotransferase